MYILLLSIGLASAHGPAMDQIAVRLLEDEARISAVLPAAAFPDADSDGDGALSREEIAANRAAILARAEREIALETPLGPGARSFADALSGHHEGSVQLMLRYRWDQTPDSVTLRCGLCAGVEGGLPLVARDDRDGLLRRGELTRTQTDARLRIAPEPAGPPPVERAELGALWALGLALPWAGLLRRRGR